MRPIAAQNASRAMRVLIIAAAILSVVSDGAYAGKLKTLYDFCPLSGCSDGTNPFAPLVADSAGNLYGTTVNGGNSSDHGSVYELQKKRKGYKYRLLYQFCSPDCDNGGGSVGGLVVDTAGNLYGTTTLGSARGVVFMFSRRGVYTVLHFFCQTDCKDGSFPAGGLTYEGAETGALYDGSSLLYGAAENGGTNNEGVIYSLKPDGTETVLYNFGASGTDSINPNTTLTPDGSGNFYGVAGAGGQFGHGAVFRTAISGGETILHSFCAKPNCKDGGSPGGEASLPGGALVMDAAGNLFGTVPNGGKFEHGVLYRLNGTSYKVLYDFCKKSKCSDGANPEAGLTIDADGNLFGVAPVGGNATSGAGVIFEFNNKLKDVYTFCNSAPEPCNDGEAPISKLLLGADGTLFGTTQQGGDFSQGPSGGGTVFQFTP